MNIQEQIDRLNELHEETRVLLGMDDLTDYKEIANTLQSLSAEVTAANARERPAFVAGWNAALHIKDCDSDDIERAWQQYRCQDETDWKAVSEEDAAKIDAAVSGSHK